MVLVQYTMILLMAVIQQHADFFIISMVTYPNLHVKTIVIITTPAIFQMMLLLLMLMAYKLILTADCTTLV